MGGKKETEKIIEISYKVRRKQDKKERGDKVRERKTRKERRLKVKRGHKVEVNEGQ